MAYVPILKGKLGAIRGLARTGAAATSEVRPLLEVLPWDAGQKPAEPIATFAKAVGKHLNGREIAVDLHWLRLAGRDGGLRADQQLSWLGDRLVDQVRLKPVVRLTDPPDALAQAHAVCARHRRGACLRLDVARDLASSTGPTVLAAITNLCSTIDVGIDALDVVLDCGRLVESDSGARRVPHLEAIVRWAVRTWQHVALAAGSAPADLKAVNFRQPVLRPRQEACLWTEVRDRLDGEADLDFADYLARAPLVAPPSSPTSRNVEPQLRYTTGREWLLLRWPRSGHGNDGMFDLCAALIARPEFIGRSGGWGDEQIDDCGRRQRSGGKAGASTQWAEWETEHHIGLVVRRLRCLGRP